MSGKGDRPRPLGVDKDKFNDNWDAIFKNKKAKATVKNENKPQENIANKSSDKNTKKRKGEKPKKKKQKKQKTGNGPKKVAPLELKSCEQKAKSKKEKIPLENNIDEIIEKKCSTKNIASFNFDLASINNGVRWSKEEDKILKEAVDIIGARNWKKISGYSLFR